TAARSSRVLFGVAGHGRVGEQVVVSVAFGRHGDVAHGDRGDGTGGGSLARGRDGLIDRRFGQKTDQRADGGTQIVTVDDHVDHAVVVKIFGALNPFGQLFADRLLDDARAGKADLGAGFGQMH